MMIAWNETTQKLYLGLEAFDNFIHRDSENQVDIYTEDGWTISTDPDPQWRFLPRRRFGSERDGYPRATVGSPSARARTGDYVGFNFGENFFEKIETREWDAMWFGHPPWGHLGVGPPRGRAG